MNSLKLSGAMVALCMVLSGCNAAAQKDFEIGQALLRKDAAFRKELTDECNARTRVTGRSVKIEMALLMKVPEAQATTTFCTRMVNGMAKGRISHADFIRAKRDGNFAAIVRALKTP